MRRIALLALLAACQYGTGDLAGAPLDAGNGPAIECITDSDCVLASSTCCGCPDFAMPEAGWASSCGDVMCPPPPTDCPAITAACDNGFCAVACPQITCDLSCAGGFVSDSAGCLTCVCAAAPQGPGACVLDSDCVEVPADCCGCANGGSDTAVLAADAQAFQDSLMCPPTPSCPGIDVCDPTATPTCLGGSCVLATAPTANTSAQCGTPDLPPCPNGTVCVLNADPTAQVDGVGTCQPS